jgi:adenylate kinase
MSNIIFLGAPGSGKGTQAKILSQKLNIPTISTGDILRLEVANESKIGLLAKKYMNEGGLVPDEVVIGIISKRLQENDCDNGFILDGFPRNLSQAISLDENLTLIKKSISAVISLEVPDEDIIKRITGRYSCTDCGSLYNKFFHNTKKEGVCDSCSSVNMTNRVDDSEEVVVNRLKVYHADTKKLIDLYAKKDLIYKVNGLKPIDLVKKEIGDSIELSLKKY